MRRANQGEIAKCIGAGIMPTYKKPLWERKMCINSGRQHIGFAGNAKIADSASGSNCETALLNLFYECACSLASRQISAYKSDKTDNNGRLIGFSDMLAGIRQSIYAADDTVAFMFIW